MSIKNTLAILFSRKKNEVQTPGFGTFFGVYLPGILSMFGVIIYLRFAWILGALGLFQTLAVVVLSCLIVFITVLSISSMATNIHVGGGGTYYIVSRSLGIEIGSAIGVPLFIAQALTISFCTVGFAESIQPFFSEIPLAYLGATTLIILMGLVYFSAAIALKTQLVIFLIIMGSLVSLFFGKPIPTENMTEAFNGGIPTAFWAGFALFFPATTGVESGVSMSGNLRSPRKSLPLGTIAVVVTGFIVYLLIPLFISGRAPRSLLISDPLIFQHIARFQFLIIAGVWAATLSSVLSGLLAAPRTLQALAYDGVFPKFLAKEWGKNKEPRIATLVCFTIAMVGVFYGSIDIIAPVLTMFYLIAYATLNLATGLEGLLNNPSWRPTFRVEWPVAISGVILSLLAMFMIDSGATICALLLVTFIYIYMKKRNFLKKWDDILHGLLVFLSRFMIYKLAHNQAPSRSWRPNFLVLSDNLVQNNYRINLASAISLNRGFLTLASVFSPGSIDNDRAERWKKMVNAHLKENNIEALVEFCMDENLLIGAKTLLTNYGMGSISPNTLVVGELTKSQNSEHYFGVIQLAYAAKKNVIIVRDKHSILAPDSRIDVWWDDESRANSELCLLLSHMLASNKAYKKTTINLNGIAVNEVAKEQRLNYFKSFLTKGRFSIIPNVYVKTPEASLEEMMLYVSAGANMVLIGMRPPQNGENSGEFKDYYHKMVQSTSCIPNAVFVICAEETNLSMIFH